MKLLVVEQTELVSKIYKNIFNAKNYDADFAKNDSECLERIQGNYDYIVFSSAMNDSQGSLEEKIRQIIPSQKVLSLGPYMNSICSLENLETREIIEKPFALLTMVAKLESERIIQNN
jgi:DNA-binding response OmpR family regulator